LTAAVDSLPAGGGEVCFAAGIYALESPIVVSSRTRVVFNGAGPASVLRAVRHEAAVVFDSSSEVEVRHLRIEGGSPGAPPGDPHLNGAVTFTGSTDVVVADCVVTCPDSTGKAQACVTVRSSDAGARPDRIRIERNRLEVGAWQTGILVVDAGQVTVADGTEDGGERIRRVLLADPGLGILRHADAGYPEAIEAAERHGVRIPMAAGGHRNPAMRAGTESNGEAA